MVESNLLRGETVRILLLAGLVTLSLVGGVQGQSPSASSASPAAQADVSALRERAAAFWAARVAGDADGQWQLLEPRGKGRMTAQQYAPVPTGGRYLAYQVEDVTINGHFATVKMRVLVQQIVPATSGRSKLMPPQAVHLDDGWIQVGGVWYRRLDAGGNTPAAPRSQEIKPD